MSRLPAITGKQLIALLVKDGWQEGRRATHGRTLIKRFGDRVRVTFVPERTKSLAKTTLMQILGPKQTQLGRKGMEEIIKKYGLP